ncbi:MAG: D-alanine--D-alanine ligase [Acidobacteriota bacterium]
MRIGLTFDLKPPASEPADGQPDDLYEEFDPPETVGAIGSAIESLGHEVVPLGGGRSFLEKALTERLDFVFNISEGQGTLRSREAQVPSVLEMLGIPYALSDPLTLALSLDKALTKRLVAFSGVAVPSDLLVRRPADLDGAERLRFPCIAKPAYEGSSKGIRDTSVVRSPEEARRHVEATLRAYGQPVLLEEFVSGDEYTVGVVGNDPPRAIGAMRIRPKAGPRPDFVYSVEVKRDWRNRVAYDVPPPLESSHLMRLYSDAVLAFRALECRDAARVDFRVRDGLPVFLEINPLPGLSPTYGDLPILARGMGIAYPQLMEAILNAALTRCGLV